MSSPEKDIEAFLSSQEEEEEEIIFGEGKELSLITEEQEAQEALLEEQEAQEELLEAQEELQEEEPKSQSMSSPVKKTVFIHGIEYEIGNSPHKVTEYDQCLYKKEDRVDMTTKTRNDLFERATKLSHDKYALMNLSVTGPEKLDDTYNLQMLVKKTKHNHIKYDMGDVFTILKLNPTDPGAIEGTVDLYLDYTQVTEQEVADSCKWYATMPADPALRSCLKRTRS